MTRTTPSRWITLHLSHIFLTDARTFISLLLAGTIARATVISLFFHGRDRAAITPPRPDHLAELSQNSSSPLRPRAPEPRLRSPASPSPPRSGAAPLPLLQPTSLFPHGRVNTHGPLDVTATQCSKCADSE